ncbi:hypothetical protein [Streptomyces sp. NPDC001222]
MSPQQLMEEVAAHVEDGETSLSPLLCQARSRAAGCGRVGARPA